MAIEDQASDHHILGSEPPTEAHIQQSHEEKQPTSEELIFSVASNVASQPLQNSNPEVWGVLTAINNNARKRKQGINVIFTSDEHCIGRLVPDKHFVIESASVSTKHCKIYRKRDFDKDVHDLSKVHVPVFIKDTSTNGTYLNREKLTQKGPEAELHHGDIISFPRPPHHEHSFAFVFREIIHPSSSPDGSVKRKAEKFNSQSKRLKGIGIGAPEGPLSLDDFRSLQKSNAELRKQLNCHILTIETLRNEKRAALECHEKEIKELSILTAQPYISHIEDLKKSLEGKKQELETANKTAAEQKTVVIDLNERLSVSSQACAEANELINNQKVVIIELKAQLNDERAQRREEREKAAIDSKAAVQKVLSEAKHELMLYSKAASRREKEQQELISKHQESGKELSLVVETMITKLEEHRQKLIISDNKVRQLESEIIEQQKSSSDRVKIIERLEDKQKRLMEDLQSEKLMREEAWEKVSNLELQINVANNDLEYERRRLNGARERILLRETQLRAFYSTTEEISALLVKQQGQLKSMQKTLEDEENVSADSELNPLPWHRFNNVLHHEKRSKACRSNTTEAKSSASTQRNHVNTNSPEVSATEKQDCDNRTQENQRTQEVDSPNADPFLNGGFGSAVNGETEPALERNFIETEQFKETECQTVYGEKCAEGLAGETMQLDEDTYRKSGKDNSSPATREASDNHTNNADYVEDTEVGDVFTTQDLMASELIGSWACSTAPSVHDENYSQRSIDNDNQGVEGLLALHNSNSQSESQNDRHYALSKMIQAVSSELKDQLSEAQENDHIQENKRNESTYHHSEAADHPHCDNDIEVEDSEAEYKQDKTLIGITNQMDQEIPLGDSMEEDHPATRQRQQADHIYPD